MVYRYAMDIWTGSEILNKKKKYKSLQKYLELCYVLIVFSGSGTVR